VKQKTVILLMFVAFMFMWACTPSSLRRDNNKEVSKAFNELPKIETTAAADAVAAVVDAMPQMDTTFVAEALQNADLTAVKDALKNADSLKLDSLADKIPVIGAVADSGVVKKVQQMIGAVRMDTLMQHVDSAAVSTAVSSAASRADSLLHDISPATGTVISEKVATAAAKLKRDTTQMDSLQLAIYKHNKAIDDSLALDSLNRQKKNGIDAPVKYSANDSLTYEAGSGRAFLYGDSHVEYQNMDLTSEKIFMVLDSSLVHATGARDSATNKLAGTPVFKMGSDTYESDTMAFNFKTKKGLISQVYTQQEDGFLTSELSKRGANGEMFLQHGRYTTCDDPHPDFYISMSRAKVRPGKDVVFGPAYLVVADVPLPLAIPYGFFPFTKNYSSGFIMPTYGDETDRGFYLRDGGYYFAINDKMDLKLIGEIFTKGSWGVTATSNYKRRYKYSGSFLFSYQNSVTGDKGMDDYQKTTSYKLIWNHRQDAKANPYSTLSASVNFVTSNFERNNLTSMYNPQALTQSTRTSSVSYSTKFSSLNMTLSTSMNIEQNMRDTTLNIRFPSLNINVSSFYPFRRKKAVGSQRWYEKISVSYRGDFNNSIHAKEDKVLHSDFRRDWQNSITHVIPINASFTAFDVVTITPNFTFTDKNSFIKTHKSWDVENQKEITDTIAGFYNIYNWSAGINLSTKLYGFFTPWKKLFGNKIQAIRHVFTPTIGFTYAPDFSASRYGYYDTYQKTDKDGNVTLVEYSPYRVGSVSPPSAGMTGSLRFDIKNNLEMKIRDKNDSLKKISIIDDFSANMSYNMAAKRQPWSALNTSIRLKLTKSYTFNLSAVFASYVYEADSVGATPKESDNVTYWQQGKIGRFQGMSQNLSYSLDNKKVANFFKWLRGEKIDKKDEKKEKPKDDEEELDDLDLNSNIDKDMEKAKHGAKREGGKAETDEDGYLAFKVPWTLSFGYGISMREDTDVKKFNYDTMRYPYKFTQTLNVSGNIRISDGWNINFSSGYDFENSKISMTQASLSRDLHCFNMSCSVVLAPYTSYNFSFRCNASTLTDALKYDKRSGNTNSVQWY